MLILVLCVKIVFDDVKTILLMNIPLYSVGAKYEFAKKWKIHIVKSDWLYDSIEKGYCLEERQFSLTDDMDDKSEVKTSTPEKENGCRGMMVHNTLKTTFYKFCEVYDHE